MDHDDVAQIKGMYILSIIFWICLSFFSFPLHIILSPLTILAILSTIILLLLNMINVCHDVIYDDKWVKNAVPIYMGFAIITLFLTIYRYSDIPNSKIYRTFIIYIVLSMILFYGPITNVCFSTNKHMGFKCHIDNILIILSIGILIYLMAIAASFPAKFDGIDDDMLQVIL